uniref:FKBP-type peptidyl-prolyl cis-trans isomerase n=1 Tax=Altererythrobacter segetis TaxID=1104773 RepID=UPI00140C61E7|nr:FKBP-type peptidyl-prolyl cis-trans isomerase [Altererythrobacter segetis]
MVEPTRVPLQPIRKGSLTKLWAGVIVVLLIAAGVAWLNVPHAKKLAGGVTIETLEAGKGPSPTTTDIALINYKGMLGDGKVFDKSEGVPMPVTGVVPGFSTALQAMQAGGKYRIRIPAAQAYGAEEKRNQQTGEVVIPANSDLTFDVDLIEFRSQEEVLRMMQQQQMMQQLQQQGGAGGAPGAPAPAPGQ